MGRPDDYWPKDELLAAALLQIHFDWDDGTRGPIMTHEQARLVDAATIISLFHKDHDPIRKEAGGPNVFWNCTFRPIENHRFKTATVDIPQIAKNRDISATVAEHRRVMLAKVGQEPDPSEPTAKPKPKWRWGTRKMAKHIDPWGKRRRAAQAQQEEEAENVEV